METYKSETNCIKSSFNIHHNPYRVLFEPGYTLRNISKLPKSTGRAVGMTYATIFEVLKVGAYSGLAYLVYEAAEKLLR